MMLCKLPIVPRERSRPCRRGFSQVQSLALICTVGLVAIASFTRLGGVFDGVAKIVARADDPYGRTYEPNMATLKEVIDPADPRSRALIQGLEAYRESFQRGKMQRISDQLAEVQAAQRERLAEQRERALNQSSEERRNQRLANATLVAGAFNAFASWADSVVARFGQR